MAQELSWDKEGGLTGKVTYSIVMGDGDELFDPANYRTFDLPFPDVHRTAYDQLYVKRGDRRVYLGHLEQGVFGTQVRLDSNVHFVAHRRDGLLWGKLVSGSSSD